MGFIDVQVTGLEEAIARSNSMINDLGNIKRQALQDVATFLAEQMRLYAHVITGQMRDSIAVQSVTEQEAVVVVSAPYAVYENARVGGIQGPHDFADRAFQDTMREGPRMVMSAFDRWASL